VLIEESRKTASTDAEIVKFIKFNLQVLQSGKYPDVDYQGGGLDKYRASLAGKPLAGNWKASFYGWTGDAKEKVKQHRFPRNWQSNFFCERCLAAKHLQDGNGFDFAESATWRSLLVNHTLYLHSTPAHLLSPWSAVDGWTIDRNHDDMLHTCWLGWCKDLIGQLLFEFALSIGPNLDRGMTALGIECRQWFKTQGVSFGINKHWKSSTISVSRHGDYPTLETKQKAAKTKLIFIWATRKAVALVNDGVDISEYSKLRADLCWNMLRCVDIFDRSSEILSQSAADEAYNVGMRALQIYSYMAARAVESQIAAWKVLSNFDDLVANSCVSLPHGLHHTLASPPLPPPPATQIDSATHCEVSSKLKLLVCCRRMASTTLTYPSPANMFSSATHCKFVQEHRVRITDPTQTTLLGTHFARCQIYERKSEKTGFVHGGRLHWQDQENRSGVPSFQCLSALHRPTDIIEVAFVAYAWENVFACAFRHILLRHALGCEL
jgi:hypothetical protein